MEKEGKYLYCIIGSNGFQSFGPLGIGGRGDELHTIRFNDIAAVASNSPIVKYPVSRENSLAHEKAIEVVMEHYTVLPVRYGIIAEDEEKVRRILEREYGRFKELLNRMEGKRELGLKAVFNEKFIYQEILQSYPEIRRLRNEIASRPPEATYFGRIEIGRMVESALKKEKEKYKDLILHALGGLAEDSICTDRIIGERMILNAAFLVNRDKEGEFDQRVNQLGNRYGDKITFKYVGTLPPFNFVNLVIDLKEEALSSCS
jgi:hypothetical protein